MQLHQDKWVGFEYDGDGNRIAKLSAMTQPWHDNGKGNDPGFTPPGKAKVKQQQADLIFTILAKGGGGGGGGNGGGSGGGSGGNSGSNSGGNGGGNSGGNGKGNGRDKDNKANAIEKAKEKELKQIEREKRKEQDKAKKGYRQKGKLNNRGKHLGWYKNGKLPAEKVEITNYLNDVSDPLTQVLMTYGEDGKYDAAYTYGLERIEVEALDETRPEAQDPLYYLYNNQDSVTYMVKPDGNIRDNYRYDAYGKPENGSKLSEDGRNVNHNTFGYTGEMWDEESNLLYLRARYYEPETGRFLTRDSYEGELQNPLSRNLYAYVQNNPVNGVDPTGHALIIPKRITYPNSNNCLTPGTLTPEEAYRNQQALFNNLGEIVVGDPNSAFDASMLQLEQSGYPPVAFGGMMGIVIKRGGTKFGRLVIKTGDEVFQGLKYSVTRKLINGFEGVINVGKQGKHIPGHPNYQAGKSILTGNAQKLLDQYAGKGQWIGQNKERVDFGQVIGKYVDPATGKAFQTTKGIIHYSKNGAHIVPARP